ncbi:Creatinase/aminopeptidase [Auricularia subglabra TFB-10046 SS5]|nr:Creatinase/aminopeptidase [Auricularia subglabra TFB-10046 SS5]
MERYQDDKESPLPEPVQRRSRPSRIRILLRFLYCWLCVYFALTFVERFVIWLRTPIASPDRRPATAAADFSHLRSHCGSVPPIGTVEFLARQRALAGVLRELGGAAYIAEPGANAVYFANISQWGTSERPFLLIVTPNGDTNSVEPAARISVLTPAFEETRARLLTIPAPEDGVHYAAWPEEGDPYATALRQVEDASGLTEGVVFVDESVRYFIAERLRNAGSKFEVKIAPPEIRALRESKSTAELALMTCANEATVLAIRAVRENMYIGITASETSRLLTKALIEAGLKSGFGLVLFGDDAARPHGGGVDRTLGKHDLVLIDAGGSLHGYSSDITRTFALPDSEIPSKHLEIWYIVHAAQAAALSAAKAGGKTGDVDKRARTIINATGYGKYFTHRLGHGIGLEVHEDPYLRGNNEVKIAVGNAFSDEPGIYIDGKVGVRLEDIFVVDTDGSARFLTAAVGGAARSPWDP